MHSLTLYFYQIFEELSQELICQSRTIEPRHLQLDFLAWVEPWLGGCCASLNQKNIAILKRTRSLRIGASVYEKPETALKVQPSIVRLSALLAVPEADLIGMSYRDVRTLARFLQILPSARLCELRAKLSELNLNYAPMKIAFASKPALVPKVVHVGTGHLRALWLIPEVTRATLPTTRIFLALTKDHLLLQDASLLEEEYGGACIEGRDDFGDLPTVLAETGEVVGIPDRPVLPTWAQMLQRFHHFLDDDMDRADYLRWKIAFFKSRSEFSELLNQKSLFALQRLGREKSIPSELYLWNFLHAAPRQYAARLRLLEHYATLIVIALHGRSDDTASREFLISACAEGANDSTLAKVLRCPPSTLTQLVSWGFPFHSLRVISEVRLVNAVLQWLLSDARNQAFEELKDAVFGVWTVVREAEESISTDTYPFASHSEPSKVSFFCCMVLRRLRRCRPPLLEDAGVIGSIQYVSGLVQSPAFLAGLELRMKKHADWSKSQQKGDSFSTGGCSR